MSSIFKYAIRCSYLKDNPVDDIFIDAIPNQVEQFLDDRERKALLSACLESTWDKLYLVVLMAIAVKKRPKFTTIQRCFSSQEKQRMH
ncbi:MAG: hypothetical protein PHF31_08625 [Methylobacter sp.]|nr:hypothetical protein [Methylobacter sp.]